MFKSSRLLAPAAASLVALAVSPALASPIANWKDFGTPGADTGLNTTSPTFGDGVTSGDANNARVAGLFGTVATPASVTLAEGETVTVSASVVLTGGNLPSNQQYRFGIYNDGGQFATTENNWAGGWTYTVDFDLFQGKTNGTFVSTTANAVDLNATKVSSGTFDPDSATPFAWSMSVTRDSATTVDIVASLTGGDGSLNQVYTANDVTTSLFTYNAATFFSSSTGLEQVAFSNVQYVPEPASLALLGLGGACMLGRRRKTH